MNLCITCSLWHSFQEIKIRGGSFQTSGPAEKGPLRADAGPSEDGEVDWVNLSPR